MEVHREWSCLYTMTGDEYACLKCDRPECDAPTRLRVKKSTIWTEKDTVKLRSLLKGMNLREAARAMGKPREFVRSIAQHDAVCAEIRKPGRRRYFV